MSSDPAQLTASTAYAVSHDRERWSSRVAFYFAAVGSAVGFGNVWRFPSLVYGYGGGAFFIPYVLALFLVGIPILVLEIALGQFYQTGDVGVFGSISPRLRGVGLSSIACGYMLVCYYSMLLAWVCNAFFDSFGSDNFWAQEEVTGLKAFMYFYEDIIGAGTVGDDQKPTRLVPENVGYSFLTWTVIYLCVAFGLKWTGRITYFTMGFPVVLLFIFLGVSVNLEGAQSGIDEYIRDSNWEVLSEEPKVWSDAVAQIFFSLSITFGIMTAYGSHCKRHEPAFVNSCVVAISNCLFSFIAGFAVFATLGYLCTKTEDKFQQGLVEEGCKEVKDLPYKSFGLVFGSWPVALGTLPGGEHWIRLFFVMLFLLGIDSAFSFMEGFLTVLQDTKIHANANPKIANRKVLSLIVALCAFLLSLMYATDAGLNFLDTVDYYINFTMLLVGGFECFAAGWVYKIEEQIDNVGANVVFTYITTTYVSVILACCLWFGLSNTDDALWAGFVALIACYAVGMALVVFLMNKKKQEDNTKTWGGMFYDLTMRNVLDLSRDLSEVVGFMPHVVWGFLIKHFIPPVIIILFALGADASNEDGTKVFGNYGGYPTQPYQVLGVLVVVFAGFLFLSSLIFPKMYDGLQRPTEESMGEATKEKSSSVHAEPEAAAEEDKSAKEDVEAQPLPEQAVEPEQAAEPEDAAVEEVEA